MAKNNNTSRGFFISESNYAHCYTHASQGGSAFTQVLCWSLCGNHARYILHTHFNMNMSLYVMAYNFYTR